MFRKFVLCAVIFAAFFSVKAVAGQWVYMTLNYDGANHTYSAEEVNLYINGEKLSDLPMPPVIMNATTLVPAREVFERLGAVVDWNGIDGEVLIAYGQTIVILKINDKFANVNGVQTEMSVAPKIINDKTMIPVRFPSEVFGLTVDWDGALRNIEIFDVSSNIDKSYTITKINNIIVPDCNLSPYFYINAESEMTRFEQTFLKDERVLLVDIYNSETDMSGEEYILPTNPYTTIITAESFIEEQYPVTRIKFELDYSVECDINMSSDRKVLELYFKKTEDAAGADQTGTEQAQAESTTGRRVQGTVVIDPGHGGNDGGTEENGVVEKDINLKIAQNLKQLFDNDPYIDARFTRLTDIYLSRPDRAAYANETGDIFISIHSNHADNKSANGVEVYFYGSSAENKPGLSSERLADIMLKNIVNETGANDRGVKEYDWDVLVLSEFPAVLCEVGFVSNEQEAIKLSDDNYLGQLAFAIYNGVVEAFEQYAP